MASLKEIADLAVGLNKKEEELLAKAFTFAERAHKGQKRKSGEPYFNHAFETAKILAELEMDAQTIAAGLLHDVLRETETGEEKIEREFGSDILFLVRNVTKLGILKYHGRERYVENLRKYFVAMANDLRVVIIRFAGRLHNLRTLEFIPEAKRKRIAIESIEVYARLASRLGMAKLKGEIEDAAFPHAYPEEYKQIEKIMRERTEPFKKYIDEIQKELERELKKNKVKVIEINQRIKRKYSLWRKLVKREMDLKKVYDIIALRVVVDSIEECYRVLGIIHSIWDPLPGRIKDYIALPKPDGYRSIHTTVSTGSGRTAEIQIRTKKMHREAAYGIIVRLTYREQSERKINNDSMKLKWFEELKNLHYTSDEPKSVLENLKLDFFNDRIFVFTPEGDVVDLPANSCAIDFAYAIHSDIGNHISGAKINDKMSKIYSVLKNGDVVEIIRSKDSHPSVKWLEHVKTAFAKKHIKSHLDKNSLLLGLKSFDHS